MIQGRISVTKKRNFQSPRKKFIQKRIETPKLNRPDFTVNKSTRRYTELRRKNNHTTNNLKFLLKTNFKFFNFSMNLLNILFISGITTISSTEITCNHGFEYRTENLPSRIIRKFYPGFNTGYRHFQIPKTAPNGHREDDSPLHVVDTNIKDTCKSNVACVSVVRYNHIEWGCTDRATKIYHTCAENFSKLNVPVENGEKYPCTNGQSKKWDGKLAYDEKLPVDKACMEKRYCQNSSITFPYCIPLTNDYPTWACDMYEGFGNIKDIAHNCKHDEKLPNNSTETDFVMKKNYYWMGTENTRYLKKDAHYHEIDRFIHDDSPLLESLPGEFHQPNILVCNTDNCNSDKFVACSFKSTSNHYNLSSFKEAENEVQAQRMGDLNANRIQPNFMACSRDPQTTTKAYFQNVTEILKPIECNSIHKISQSVIVLALIIASVVGLVRWIFVQIKKRFSTTEKLDYEMARSRLSNRQPNPPSWKDQLFESCCLTQRLHNDGTTALFANENHNFEYSRDY